MNSLDKQYTDLLQTILDYGVEKKDRTGTGTKSIFGYTIRHNMKDGFPLLTTKKMFFKGIVTELLWFLRGDTNIKYLVDNDCHIWDGDAYKNYLKNFTPPICPPTLDVQPDYYEPMSKGMFIYGIKTDDEFAKKWGELGPVYGKQWRNWTYQTNEWYDGKNHYDEESKTIDQIANLINDLKTNPDSRRLMVNAWNVGELDQMTLPPCHYGFQVYTREMSGEERQLRCPVFTEDSYGVDGELRSPITIDWEKTPKRAISLMWNQRSVDTFLGLPFNIASYGLLLEIIAKEVNMVPDQLIGNLGDTHLYLDHIEQAKEQIGRELRVDERVCMCYENHKLDLSKLQEGMSDDEFTKVCDEFGIPTRTREPFPLPKLDIHPGILDYDLNKLELDMFTIKNYQSHPTIKAPLSN